MQGDELVDGELGPFGRLAKIRTVVMRRDLDIATTFYGGTNLRGFCEPHDLTLGVGRSDPQRIEPRDDGRIGRDSATVTERVPRIRERAGAIRDRLIDVVAELDEERPVAERADPWFAQDRNDATFTLALPSASRTARAISGAPGVSP